VIRWVRRWLTAAAFSAMLLTVAAGPAGADPGDPDPGASSGADAGAPAGSPTGSAPKIPAPELPTGEPTVGPTGAWTDPPTAQPTADDPASQTPTPPQDTDVTQSAAMPAGGGQVGLPLPQRPEPGAGQNWPAGAAAGAEPPADRPATAPAAGLADTGVRVAVPLGVAALLLLTGTAAVLAGRRRHTGLDRLTGGPQ
jgi:hypothetical protein